MIYCCFLQKHISYTIKTSSQNKLEIVKKYIILAPPFIAQIKMFKYQYKFVKIVSYKMML